MKRDWELWTAEVWADVYGFALRKGEGWASRKDTHFAGKFRAENDPKDWFYPVDCRNPRECRVIEFLLPILYPGKLKRLSITMANTIFGALSKGGHLQAGARCRTDGGWNGGVVE